MKLSSVAAWLLCVVFFGLVTAAQTTSTEILGTVTDPSGAVVTGAKVRLLRVTTGSRSASIRSPRRLPDSSRSRRPASPCSCSKERV